ncbi:MAG: alpha/beta hydrolase [Lachnospiraceae bacterium]|jgi:acetyl esterase/lipase|nr:alpha/beta hydrolase [Lachnospiraceae bacterium]
MERKDKVSLGRMQLIRRVHGLVERDDIAKSRQTQAQAGVLLGNTKEILYQKREFRSFKHTEPIQGEWVSIVRPHPMRPVILYCHGGGYSTGSSLYARFITSKLALATSMEIFCFDYRLAPEFPYPAALEDAEEAWDSLMLMGYGAHEVIVAGDSAGGNLALALTLKLKKDGRQLPKGLFLLSPWTDLTGSGESMIAKKEWDPVLDPEYIDRMIHAYAKGRDLKDPFISPLFGNYKRFVPVYIQVGENEVLLDDSTRLYKKLREAGVAVKLDVYPGMWHVFQMTPFKAAREAIEKGAQFLFDLG